MDHLESSTYDTFEKDPHKYALYERAVFMALQHEPLLVSKRQRAHSDEQMSLTTAATAVTPTNTPPDPKVEVIIYVLGAGRGPLIQCALQAATQARTPVRIYALEKNPHAIVTLRNRVHNGRLNLLNKRRHTDDWIALHNDWSRVTVFEGDARTWTPPPGFNLPKADLIISEMLGSFGTSVHSLYYFIWYKCIAD
jgi:protein arginine N-methyltransferase 5